MKQYLVVDLNSDYTEKMNYKGLKDLLVETIGNDLLSNYGEYEIVKDCYSDLAKMAREDINMNWVKEKLLSYSYKVIDLLDLQRDLEDAKQYFAPNENSLTNNCFNQVIDKINKGVNE